MTRYADDLYYISPEEERALEYDALLEKAQRMLAAIEDMESALCGATSLIDLPDTWGEPRHRDSLGVNPKMTAGEIYRICDAFRELNAIVNDPAFSFDRSLPVDKPSPPVAPDDDIAF